MNDADQFAIAHIQHDVPFDDDAYRILGECSPVGQAALLLGQDNTALLEWYERPGEHTASSIARVLSVAVDRDDVIERVDAHLADDPRILEDLVRSRVTWDHPDIPGLLDRADFRIGAAWHLVQTRPDELADWLTAERQVPEVGNVARAVALAAGLELFEPLGEWVELARDEPGRWSAKIEGALFTLDPRRWARGHLGGMWDAEFLEDWVAMADVLSIAPPSYWSATLAALRKESDEFALISRLAAAGASAALLLAPEEPLERVVDAFDAEDWDVLAQHPLFATAVSLADDEELHVPVLESAAHDLLSVAGIPSPGIAGLPLSATRPPDDAVEWAARMLNEVGDDPEQLIPVVATLFDFQELRDGGDDRLGAVHEAIGELAKLDGVAAKIARTIVEPTPVEHLERSANGTGIECLAAAEELAVRTAGPRREPLELIELWADGPVLRSSLYSGLVHQNLLAITLD